MAIWLFDSWRYLDNVLTYYSDRTVEITSRELNIYGHVFALQELGDVWHCEAGRQPDGSRARGHEIWTVWRGNELLLLQITNDFRFGQIYRAIQRALEQNPRVIQRR